MTLQTGLLLVAGGIALATGAAIWFRRGRLRSILWSGTVVCFLALTAALGLPISPIDTAGGGTDILYKGIHSKEYFQRLEEFRSDRPFKIIGLEKARALVPDWAMLEEPIGTTELPHGITMEVAIEDLRNRLGELRAGGNVYFFVPRSNDPARDKAALDSLLREESWLAPRLVCLYPGYGRLRHWPTLPALKGEAPAVIDQNVDEYSVEFVSDVPAGSDVSVHGWVYSNDAKSIEFNAANQQVRAVSTPVDPLRLQRGTTLFRGGLPSPGPGRTSTVALRMTTSFGEEIAALQLSTRCEAPEVPILIPAGKTEASSDLAALLKNSLNLPVRPIRIDLLGSTPGSSLVPPEELLGRETDKLRDVGILFVDIDLSKEQGENLVKLLELAASKNGAAPTPVFVGTDGLPSPSPGWHPFLGGMGFEQAVGRQVALLTDQSGSMQREVARDYPQLVDRSLSDPSKTRKIDLAYAIAKRLDAGLRQRDVNNVILPIRNRHPFDGNDGAQDDMTGKGQEGAVCSLAEYSTLSPEHHHWEGGPQLVALRRLIERDGQPISDAFLVWDCDDIAGVDVVSNFPPNLLTDEQKEAAAWLEGHGVRLHIVSIGGNLNPAVPEFIRKSVFVHFPEMKSLDELLASIEQRAFENVLPRLTVQTEAEGLKSIPQAKADALVRVVANPELRLINVIHKYADRAADTRKADILLWGNHYSPAAPELGSPLFMRGRYQSSNGNREAYWLTLDLRAELAASGRAGAKQRDALADLVIASINVVTDSLNRSPVIWQVDATGQLVMRLRNRNPLNPQRIEAVLLAEPGLSASGGKPDTRQLTAIAIRFPELPVDRSREAKVTLVDFDPLINEQVIRLPLTGTPPLPLTDRVDRDLFGQDYSSLTIAGAPGAAGNRGVSATTMAGFVLGAWILWGLYVWRG